LCNLSKQTYDLHPVALQNLIYSALKFEAVRLRAVSKPTAALSVRVSGTIDDYRESITRNVVKRILLYIKICSF